MKTSVKAIDISSSGVESDPVYNSSGSCLGNIFHRIRHIFYQKYLSILADDICILPNAVFEYCGRNLQSYVAGAEGQKLLLSKGVVPGTQHIHLRTVNGE